MLLLILSEVAALALKASLLARHAVASLRAPHRDHDLEGALRLVDAARWQAVTAATRPVARAYASTVASCN